MELIINRDFSRHQIDFYLFSSQGADDVFYHFDGKNLVEQRLPRSKAIEMTEIKPFISTPFHFDRDLIQAFMNVAQENNIQFENENITKGKLVATEKHLEDMREFSKLLLMNKVGKK